jgi:hypothetical protein
MDPNTPQYWATIFWEHFKPQVASGRPVYFTFDSSLISRLFRENIPQQSNIENTKIEEYFNVACSKLLSLDKSKATVKAFTYEPIENGFSCAIVLVAQQILVVEEMAKADNFTHDAYYPRYREKIKFIKQGVRNHQNPFDVEDFVDIWQSLRRDIQSIPGFSDYSITFKEGKGSKNLTRNFPISQALFAPKDLVKLRNLTPTGKAQCESFRSSSSLQRFFDQHKWEITKRSRDKIYIDGMRRQLYIQFRNFLDIPEESLPKISGDKTESIKTDKQGVFIIDKESKGIREEFYLRFQINFETAYYDHQVQTYLDSFTQQGDIFLFTKTEDFMGYSNSESFREITGGDSFVLFYKNENEVELKPKLNILFNNNWDNIFFKIDLTYHPKHSFFICSGLPNDVETLFVKSGRLTDEPISSKKRLECLGGIVLDKTQNLYLKNYPPEKFKAGSYSLSHDDVVTINNIPVKINELMIHLLQVDDYDSFFIQYKDFQVVLKIKSRNQDAINPIGFKLISNDKTINPLASENSSDIPSLRGWVLPHEDSSIDAANKIEFEMFEVAWLMRGSDRTWIPTTEKAIQLVIDNLQNDKIPNSIEKILENRLLVNKSLPVSLITRHKDLELAHTN